MPPARARVPARVARLAARLLAVLALAATMAACASLRPRSGTLCRALADFADATPVGAKRTVAWTAGWANPQDKSGLSFLKDCRHDGDEAGRKLCAYLVEHTSGERLDITFHQAVKCLAGENASTRRPIAYRRLEASVEGALPSTREDVLIGLDFAWDGSRAPVFEISATSVAP